MRNKDYIDILMERLGYEPDAYSFSDNESNSSLDYASYLDPELSFNPLKLKLINNQELNRKISDNSLNHIDLIDKINLDGNTCYLNVHIESYNYGNGTRIGISTKYIEKYVNNGTKVFLSVSDTENYLSYM